MTHRVRLESVLDRWSVVVERSGSQEERFLESVARRFQRTKLPGITAATQPVRFGRGRVPARQALVLGYSGHPDLRCYVSTRSLGRHLEVLRLVTLEPPLLKRSLASLLRSGAWWTWSMPRGIHGEEEVRSILTVVDSCIRDAARAMATRLGERQSTLGNPRRDVLDQWE